jgi:hypothetical protein
MQTKEAKISWIPETMTKNLATFRGVGRGNQAQSLIICDADSGYCEHSVSRVS